MSRIACVHTCGACDLLLSLQAAPTALVSATSLHKSTTKYAGRHGLNSPTEERVLVSHKLLVCCLLCMCPSGDTDFSLADSSKNFDPEMLQRAITLYEAEFPKAEPKEVSTYRPFVGNKVSLYCICFWLPGVHLTLPSFIGEQSAPQSKGLRKARRLFAGQRFLEQQEAKVGQ